MDMETNSPVETKSAIVIFLDDDPQPLGTFKSPINFELDTTRLVDGEHILRVVSVGPQGKEGVRKIPFKVMNGPDIAIEGLKENQVVDGVVPLIINAYDKGNAKHFLIESSEVPRSIPAWVWVIIILFGGWALYYFVTYLNY